MNLSLRPERPGDDEFLLGLYACTRAAEMAIAPWSDAQKEAFLRSQFQLQRTHYRHYYPDARFDVIEASGLPIGRLYIHRTPGEIRLMDIALIPNYRNRGLGAMLMRQLAVEAQATASRITLHVEADNPALRLYERLGFRALKTNGPYLFMEWRPDSAASQASAEGHSSDASC